MLIDERREFGALLRQLRMRKHYTLRGLAAASCVPFPNICALECGRLGAGRIVGRKLAAGLRLSGNEKKTFLACAAFTNSRDRLERDLLAYPAILANLLPGLLRAEGIKPKEIVRTWWLDAETIHHPSPDSADIAERVRPKRALTQYLQREQLQRSVVVVFLKNGRQVVLQCKMRIF